MTERDELPKGWFIIPCANGTHRFAVSLDRETMTGNYRDTKDVIAAAWRIVDAEREADAGRSIAGCCAGTSEGDESMTGRCEPPEEWRDVAGWHWIKGPHSTGPLCWVPTPIGGQWQRPGNDDISSEEAVALGCVYLCPVPSPETISDLVTALNRIAHMHHAEAMIAIAALHKYDPSRRVLNNSPLPVIDTGIKPPAQYYPERQG